MRKLKTYFMILGALVLALVIALPSVGAYEGQLVDVKAHDTIPVTKEARLANADEIATYIPASCTCDSGDCNSYNDDWDWDYQSLNWDNDGCDGGGYDCDPPALCQPCVYNKAGTFTAWDRIHAGSCIAWIVTIYVSNPLDYTMYDVKIFDEFNENVKIKKISASTGLNSVTIQDGNRVEYWQIGTLQPDDTACLTLIVWTKCVCRWEQQRICTTRLPSPPLNLGCSLFNVFYGLFNQGVNCDDDCEWKLVCVCHCKNLKQSGDGKYYLQRVHTCDPCIRCGTCPPCEPSSGIVMTWDYDEAGERVSDSYTGGPLLEITVYN